MIFPLFQEISRWVNPHGTPCISFVAKMFFKFKLLEYKIRIKLKTNSSHNVLFCYCSCSENLICVQNYMYITTIRICYRKFVSILLERPIVHNKIMQ